MNEVRATITSFWAAFFILGCGSQNPDTPAGGSGGGAVVTGGAGGSTTVTSGGTNASLGGTANPGLGGSSGAAAGTSANGGSGGNLSATGGAPSAGSAGTPAAGAPGSGGSSIGGASGTGGSPAGGSGGGGGTPVVVDEPQVVTSAKDAYWKVGTLTEAPSATADVTVNDSMVAQDWTGMGGTFNEVGWNVLMMLNAGDRDRAIKLLFDAADGARFANARLPIGASDYALMRYTLNETANDTAMTNFSIERDKQYLIPYIKAALAVKPDIHLWASPWTPPSWMKDNNAIDAGKMKEDETTFKALALYLAKFVEEYAKEGITIEAIHPQNEPNYAPAYPSCMWTAAGLSKFIGSHLGPTFESRGVKASIFLGTMSNNDAGADGTIITTVTGDAAAMKYVKGFGLQWNMLPVVASLKSRNLPIVQSEHKCGNYHWNPAGFPAFNPDKAPNDYPYAVESWGYIRDWVKAGTTTYSAWNMVLDTAGKNSNTMKPWPQNALLTVDIAAKTLTVTPTYYVFRHVSQYVDPGAKVVGTTGGDALAFKNPDGTIVTVLYNSGAAKKMTVAVGGKKEQFDMPANGWATVNWKGG